MWSRIVSRPWLPMAFSSAPIGVPTPSSRWQAEHAFWKTALPEERTAASRVPLELERLVIGSEDVLAAGRPRRGEEPGGAGPEPGVGVRLEQLDPRRVHVAAADLALLDRAQEGRDPGRSRE